MDIGEASSVCTNRLSIESVARSVNLLRTVFVGIQTEAASIGQSLACFANFFYEMCFWHKSLKPNIVTCRYVHYPSSD